MTINFDAFCESHCNGYSKLVGDCCQGLKTIWTDVGFDERDAENELSKIEANVANVWRCALQDADKEKEKIAERIKSIQAEIDNTKAQLGEQTTDNGQSLSPNTLKTTLDHLLQLKTQYIHKREQRIAEFKDLFELIKEAQKQFGQSSDDTIDFDGPNCDLTIGNLDFWKSELDSFYVERSRRLTRLESLWRPLKLLCSDLGEDLTEVAKSVHPSLEHAEKSISNPGIPLQSIAQPVLSEEVFTALETKLTRLTDFRSEREKELSKKREVVLSLWKALQMSMEDDLDRSILYRMMEGPARLHRKTFENMDEEIKRQETTKSRSLRDLIDQKIEDIKTICSASRLPVPSEILDMTPLDTEGSSGSLSDAVARLTRIQTDLTVLSEKRGEILALIQELEFAKKEAQWLKSYEHDVDRYKGRDCNRKLNRSIKAGKLRDKIPSMAQKLMTKILDWEQTEHKAFLLDGLDYRTDVLEKLRIERKVNDSGRRTPAGRRSAIPDYPMPCQSARGASKGSLSNSMTFGEARSIPRPQTSIGHFPYKDSQTDYHPLQERLDRLLGNKSGIPPPPSKTESSDDDIMEDVVHEQPKMSFPPPKLNLTALHNSGIRRPSF